MKVRNLVKGIFVACTGIFGYILITAQYDNPSNGKTGAPGEGECAECHTPNNPNFEGSLELTGLPEQVFTGGRYTISIKVSATQGDPKNAGIQLVALDSRNMNVGDLRNPMGLSGIISMEGKTYFEHKGGPTKFNADGEANWSVDWLAPEDLSTNQITIYAATLIGDGDSTVAGDLQILENISATLVEGNAPLAITTNKNDISCGGTNDGSISANVTGGVLPYQYLWSNGDSTATISNLAPGNYSVTVTDADTSSLTASVSINAPTELNLSIEEVTGLTCSGQMDASAILSISGGNPPYSVSWPDGDTALTKDNLGVGDFDVVVFDNSGCSDTTTVTIEATINVQPNTVSQDESEPGSMDGLAYVVPSGGTPPYLISWSNGSTEDTIRNLAPGVYSVIVADISGCLIADTVTIAEGVCDLEISTAKSDLACGGEGNGSVSVLTPANQLVSEYEWSTGDTTRAINNLSGGQYIIKVIDTFGCVGIDTLNLIEPTPLTVDLISVSSSSCDESGSATINVIGGTTPYTVSWGEGIPGTDTTTLLDAGDYILTVTDGNGCEENLAVNISTIDNTAPNLQISEYTLFLNAEGVANLNEISPDEILFDACGIDSVWYSVTEFTCVSEPSAVAVQAWDAEGNMLNSAFLVNVLDTIGPVAPPIETVTLNGCDTFFYDLPIFSDNCQLDTVVISSGFNSGSVFPDGRNEVVFQGIDASGNSTSAILEVIVEVNLSYDISKNQVICAADSVGRIVIESNPADQYSFQWDNGIINDTLAKIPAGFYTVTITDTTGCFAIEEVEMEANLFEIAIDTLISQNASGEGEIQVSIVGGNPPFEYTWFINGGQTVINGVEDLVNLFDGVYELQVTDANGCTISSGEINLSSTVSSRRLEELNINLYPNPAEDWIQLSVPKTIQVQQISIVDLNGKTYTKAITGRQIDIAELGAGLYFIYATIQGHSYFSKFVKR